MKKHILLSDYIKVANIHAERLEGALLQASHVMPLSVESLSKLPSGSLS